MDNEETLVKPQPPAAPGAWFVRIIKKPLKLLFWAALVYSLVHAALVPVFSAMTRTEHRKTDTPKNWGLPYLPQEVKSSLGITIPAWYVPGSSKMPIILVLTGSGGNKYGAIARQTTLALHEKGYNVFLFDTRGQGMSGGVKTFGIGEAVDVLHVLDYLSVKFPGKKIGAVGFSLGAASLLRAAGMDNRLSAVAAYASYSDLDAGLIRNEVSLQLKTMLRGKLSRRHQKYAELGATAARWIVCPALVKLSLKLWSFTFRSIPSPREAVARSGAAALLLMQNDGDPEMPINHLQALWAAAKTARKAKALFRSNTHEPPLWSEQFRSRFKTALQTFFHQHG